ncbi:MAG: DinB family protein [Pseudomonadota bacterium]
MTNLRTHCRLSARNNRYANAMIAKACAELGAEGVWAKGVNFFPSIGATLNHILAIDRYYIDALEEGGRGRAIFDEHEDIADPAALAAAQEAEDIRLIRFCDALTEVDVDRRVKTDRNAGMIEETIGDLLPHLFGHDIHHRGQIHAMLAGTKVAPPQLDDFWLDYRRVGEAEDARAL